MRVFKFGGASVKNAEAVKNVGKIIEQHGTQPLMVVVSAMDKTTNQLEKVAQYYLDDNREKAMSILQEIRSFHIKIAKELFGKEKNLTNQLNNILVEIEWVFDDPPGKDPALIYDQIVSMGEMLSTRIISAHLNATGISNAWLDARELILTDSTFKNAKVLWPETADRINTTVEKFASKAKTFVTQGFVGSTDDLMNTTLGREGSDFTAAILAYCTNADDVTIWKDVPGVMNANPKRFPEAVLIPHISYQDAVELAYYGTSVIHPKTIKPLQNKDIPLHVKSFNKPDGSGTVIDGKTSDNPIANYITKDNQVLVSIHPRDFSFIVECNLERIFQALNKIGITSNLMQNSALSFSFSMDDSTQKLNALQTALGVDFELKFNANCRLLTIRHFNEGLISKLVNESKVILEQRTRDTVQLVLLNTI